MSNIVHKYLSFRSIYLFCDHEIKYSYTDTFAYVYIYLFQSHVCNDAFKNSFGSGNECYFKTHVLALCAEKS